MRCNKVVFPLPFGPTNATDKPGDTASVVGANATVAPRCTHTPSNDTTDDPSAVSVTAVASIATRV